MSQRFQDKVVFITGAASGIGRATAKRMALDGARVACSDINEKGLAETVEMIGRAPAEVRTYVCDIADPVAGRQTIDRCARESGGLDVLCNIAGMGNMRHTEEVRAEEWNRVLAVNLNGTFFMSQAALPHLLARKGSSIVNVASLAGLIGQAYCAAYCASKAAVVSLTKVMAIEFVKRGLRVNCVCPGGVVTPILAQFAPPEGADMAFVQRLSLVPKLTPPEEIADAIAFLASEAAASINGVALPLDFGVHAA